MGIRIYELKDKDWTYYLFKVNEKLLPYDVYTLEDYLRYHGKWLVYGKNDDLEKLKENLLKNGELVKRITGIKLSQTPADKVEVETDLEGPHVLIVYCDCRLKDDVK